MYLYVAETKKDNDNHLTAEIIEEITQEELDDLNSAFTFCGIYHRINQIKDIVIENGIEFQQYMKSDNLSSMSFQGVSPEKLILIANKLVFNYASSIKTYIDMETRLLRKNKGENELKLFRSICSQMYDNSIEYRFWANFRNYVVHCEFPYAVFHNSIDDGCKVICLKDDLLKFDNWKHSKNDIEKMDNEIDIPSLVNNMSSKIIVLFWDFFTYFGQEIVDRIEKYGSLGLFRAHEVPEIEAIVIDKPGLNVACGAIGIGEITSIPTAPAITDAYYRCDGERRYSLPISGTPYERRF